MVGTRQRGLKKENGEKAGLKGSTFMGGVSIQVWGRRKGVEKSGCVGG